MRALPPHVPVAPWLSALPVRGGEMSKGSNRPFKVCPVCGFLHKRRLCPACINYYVAECALAVMMALSLWGILYMAFFVKA